MQADPFALAEPAPHRFSPLVSWLVATIRPPVTVELGSGERASLISTFAAVLQTDATATCAAVLLPAGVEQEAEEFGTLLAELSGRFGESVQGYETERTALSAMGEGRVDFVHVAVFDSEEMALPDIEAWLQAMAPGAVMVITTTASDASSSFVKMKGYVMDNVPSVSVSLGLTTEAVVAQRPIDDGAPIVEMLQRAPFAGGRLSDLVRRAGRDPRFAPQRAGVLAGCARPHASGDRPAAHRT